MATPYMSLDLPVVSSTLGPEWATLLNTALSVIDGHGHTSGSGRPISTSALLIDADFSFSGFNATEERSCRFREQSSALGDPSDVGCLYNVLGELYYNDGNGTQIQITAGGALNAASIGGIGGDYGTSDASVFYTTASTAFTFWQDTNEAAFMEFGAISIYDTGVSANSVTIQTPNPLSASYDLTLPTGLPASTSYLTVTSAGVIGTKTLTVNQASSSSSGSFNTSSTSFVDVTNLSVSITSTGRPVFIAVQSDGTTGAGSGAGFDSSTNGYVVQVLRDATVIAVAFGNEAGMPMVNVLDAPSSGTYTYKVQIKALTGGTAFCIYSKLVAYEL